MKIIINSFFVAILVAILFSSCSTQLTIGKNQTSTNTVGVVSDSVAITAVDSLLNVIKSNDLRR